MTYNIKYEHGVGSNPITKTGKYFFIVDRHFGVEIRVSSPFLFVFSRYFRGFYGYFTPLFNHSVFLYVLHSINFLFAARNVFLKKYARKFMK